jgi:C4-dicarboxylate transporter/malic acid transport protein
MKNSNLNPRLHAAEYSYGTAVFTRRRPWRAGPISMLDDPRRVFEHITPNWFASVMGTGIVATAAATLPVHIPGLRLLATIAWAIAATALTLLTAAFAVHWIHHRANAKAYASHPIMAQFYGAPAMAALTVGAGTMTVGSDVLGASAALHIDVALWTVGTVMGLITAVKIPYDMITSHSHESVIALPAWLMPIVPPMVSASTGALLIPHVGQGQFGRTFFLACYAMFGLSLLVAMITITMIYSRLVHAGLPATQSVPTVWITLGALGQSITAANLLGARAGIVFEDARSLVSGLHVFGVLYGSVVAGFAAFVFALATALTVHAVRQRLTFSLTWWSFTFPIGTCVTGAGALGVASNVVSIQWLAAALFVVLLSAWATVATHTLRGLWSGQLLRAADATPPPVARLAAVHPPLATA